MANRENNRSILRLARTHLPELLAMLGGILYLIEAIIYAHIRLPNLDEGSYLYKGYLLATGVYQPFQPYGFWINKMYLSFFIWGWVQAVFAPGLLAPRSIAVLLSVLALLGLWILSRRIGNRWLATIAVWVLVLNPTIISIYSTARAEVLITFMLTWVLVLCLGADRPVWQVVVSAILAGIMILTRENMVFILPLFVLYVFWQHGRKKGFLALLSVTLVLVVGHIIYWPGIMYLWERWLPASIIHLLGLGHNGDLGTSALTEPLSLESRLHSLSQAIRVQYIPFIGSLLVLFLWPKRKSWPTTAHFRAAVFLASLFFILFISHAWASIGDNYCVYCLNDYMTFWGNVGILLIIVSIGALNKTPSVLRKAAIFATLLLTTTAIGYALFEQISGGLMKIPVPRLRSGNLLPGWATLWQVLSNKYHLVYADARGYIPAIAGLLVGFLLLIISSIVFRHHPYRKTMYFASFIAYGFLSLGLVLLPLLSWTYDENLCRNDVITSYEKLGAQLASIAPPGTKIYLDASISDVVLLYTRGEDLLLPQLNDNFSFVIGGDSDLVSRNNHWNDQLGLQWRDAAEVFVIEEDRMSGWRDYLTPDKFEQIPFPESFSCNIDANILLFKRK
jgi:hypothetical protein